MSEVTTHVLDLVAGRPAEGLAFVLSRLDDPPGVLLRSRTNRDGRTDKPLLSGPAVIPGRYELAFEVAEYFGASHEDVAFLDIVPIRFGVAAGAGHVHVALLVTPWSYTTYRGS